MRSIALFSVTCAVISLVSISAQAQLALRGELDRKNYLQYENIFIKLTMRNLSGHPLAFGDNPQLKGDLTFEFESPDGKIPEIIDTTYSPLFGQVLEPGETESVNVALLKLYRVKTPGKYKIRAIIRHSQLADKYQSNSMDFSVTTGMKVWGTPVGIPSIRDSMSDDEKIKTRNYKIVTFYDGLDKIYSLIVEDDKFIYGIARVGFDIGNGPPFREIDRMSKIHILSQAGPSVYSYYVYDINCNLEGKEVYVASKASVPILVRDPKAGTVVLAGGKKGVLGVDFVEVEGKPKINDDIELLKQPSP